MSDTEPSPDVGPDLTERHTVYGLVMFVTVVVCVTAIIVAWILR